jgi:arylsulfatase A-like enzyme
VKRDMRMTLEDTRPLSRRQVLAAAAGAAAMALANRLPFGEGMLSAAPRKRPNIVFILTDDHRFDMLGALGHPFLKTPNMDRLVREGILFTNAFVTTSLCSPSRASFLTGRYASSHGVINNFTPWNNDNVTFMETLKKAGYDTAFIGKWHMPGVGLPRLRGVDLFVSFTKKDGQGDYYDCPLFVNHTPVTPRKEYITEELTDYALDFIKERKDRPFCLYLSHKAVHHDWKPPRHLKGMYKNEKIDFLAPESDKWNTWSGNNWLEGSMGSMHGIYRRYCECLTSVDEQLGRVLKQLDEMGILDDTVIVYAGDNGYMWGEHRLYAKHWPYEESMRIPFVVRYPRLVRDPGRRARQMALNIDLFPTLLELAGARPERPVDGKSLVPVLRDAKTPGRSSFMYELFKDFPFGGRVPPHRAVRTERHKYIEWEACRANELYDLEEDPRELMNIIGTGRDKGLLPAMKKELERLKGRYAAAR